MQTKEVIKSYRANYKTFAEKCQKVKDHDTAKIVPFIFRRGQQILHNVAEKQKAEKGYVRILNLKSRRYGGSTYVEGRFYRNCSLFPNRHAFIVAHEEESTSTLFEMARLFHELNPLAPQTRKSNAKELVFDTENGKGLKSQYRLATARNVEAGKSQGVHYLHNCLDAESLIILADGSSVRVGSIEIGDNVITSSGAIAPIKNIFDTGMQKTYSVSTWLSNEPVGMTAEHKVLTQDGYKQCADLIKGDYVRLPSTRLSCGTSSFTYELPYVQRKQGGGNHHQETATIPFNYDFGYYVGYYLAEGSLKSNNVKPQSVNFTYHKDETFIEKADKFASQYATSSNLYTENNKHRTTYYGVFLAGLTEAIAGRAGGKHIPEWFFRTNPRFIKGVLNGYFDGDGSKVNFNVNVISAISVHEKISRQLKRLIVAMDYGVPSLHFYDNRWRYEVKSKDAYAVNMSGDTYRRYTSIDTGLHKATKYKKIDGRYFVKIKSIKQDGISQTYDIEIDHPDHNFETSIGIVSNSEEAMWQGGGHELLSGLLQCVPDPPAESEIFRESTAKGYGNSFQIDCMKAYDSGKNVYYEENGIPFAWNTPGFDYILVFIPWFVHEKYTREFESPEEKAVFEGRLQEKVFDKEALQWIDSEPLKLLKKYDLTLEQLNWREWAIENKCRDSLDIFHQEYPSNVLEAFLSKGSSVYSSELCDTAEAWCREPLLIGNLVDRNGKIKINPSIHGYFRIWENPQSIDHKSDVYIITCDAGGGIRQESVREAEKRDPDPTCIDVWNRSRNRQAAQWRGHVDYDQIDEVVEMVGNLFIRKDGLPMACIEQNNHGWAVVKGLKEKSYPMYEHRTGDPGFRTDKITKPLMVDNLRKDVRNGKLLLMCKETVSEMRTFKEMSGKYGAESGCHDDRVMSAAMASMMFRALPLSEEKAGRDEGIINFTMRDRSVEGYQEIRV